MIFASEMINQFRTMDRQIRGQTISTGGLGSYRRNNAILYLSTTERRHRQRDPVIVMGLIFAPYCSLYSTIPLSRTFFLPRNSEKVRLNGIPSKRAFLYKC